MSDQSANVPERRAFLLGGAMLGGAVAAGSVAHAATPAKTAKRYTHDDLMRATADPKDNLKLYMKLKGDTSGKPYLGWYSGHVFGNNQGEMTTPLFGIEGFGIGYMNENPDGSFSEVWKEVGYYKDLVTDEIITKWKNPYTGMVCDVMPINNRSVNTTHKPYLASRKTAVSDGSMFGEYILPPGPSPRPFTIPWFVHDDFVVAQADARFVGPNPLDPKVWPRESTGDRYSVTEFYASYGSLSELLDPTTTTCAATGHWARLVPWMPWMVMGQRPGQVAFRCAVKKMFSIDEVPQKILEYTKAHYPNYLYPSTPEEAALPPESSWEVFKRTRKPLPPL